MSNELKSCPSCGEMVSKYSISCPKCGANWQVRAMIKYFVPAFVVVLLIACAVYAINKAGLNTSTLGIIIAGLITGSLIIWSSSGGED